MYAKATKAIIALIIATFGIAPDCCESCGRPCLPSELETHLFADEYDDGLRYYERNICPACVKYWENEATASSATP